MSRFEEGSAPPTPSPARTVEYRVDAHWRGEVKTDGFTYPADIADSSHHPTLHEANAAWLAMRRRHEGKQHLQVDLVALHPDGRVKVHTTWRAL